MDKGFLGKFCIVMQTIKEILTWVVLIVLIVFSVYVVSSSSKDKENHKAYVSCVNDVEQANKFLEQGLCEYEGKSQDCSKLSVMSGLIVSIDKLKGLEECEAKMRIRDKK